MTTYDASFVENNGGKMISDQSMERYAGFWMRFWAYMLDLIVVLSLQGIVLSAFLPTAYHDKTLFSLWTAHAIVSAIVYYTYFLCMTKYFQATLGKMVFALKVVRTDRESLAWSDLFFREVLGRILYNILFGLKILYVILAFTKEKQGIHDMISSTRVVHVT